MSEREKTYRIFLSAAEPSADSHCAGLIRVLKQSNCGIEFVGAGGPKMAEAGCKLLETTINQASMMYKSFSRIGYFYKLLCRIRDLFAREEFDLVITCDSPAFNFHVAKAAKKTGIKTLFYVAPQLWAWAGWRINKLRKYCDKLCCILPFEQKWFESRGINVVFTGNPLFDEFQNDLSANIKNYNNFKPSNARIALIPGSREGELNSLWKPMQKIAIRLRQKYPGINFTTVAVDPERQGVLARLQIQGFGCKYAIASVSQCASEADFAIVTSGSATLEVAAAGCPMVIMYQCSRILWHLVGRWLIKTRFLSLVNILAGRELVPEFMPYFSSIEPVKETIEQFLGDNDKLSQTSRELVNLVNPLTKTKASRKTAEVVLKMLDA
jgi:lipid-A-disaccharide synthase